MLIYFNKLRFSRFGDALSTKFLEVPFISFHQTGYTLVSIFRFTLQAITEAIIVPIEYTLIIFEN